MTEFVYERIKQHQETESHQLSDLCTLRMWFRRRMFLHKVEDQWLQDHECGGSAGICTSSGSERHQ